MKVLLKQIGDVKIYQTKKGNIEGEDQLFSVQYGLQYTTGLTYSEACKELGESILHDLNCKALIT
jgi:hypothetical protein